MLFEDCREAKPAGQRAGREWQLPFPPAAVGAGERIPQRAVVRCPKGVVDERGVERHPLPRRLHETAGILVGARAEQMGLRGGFRAETAHRDTREQLDGPFRRALPQREVRRQEVAFRCQIFGDGLSGKLIHQLGGMIRPPDVEKQRDGLQHQILSRRSPCAARQRRVLVRGFLVTAIRDELQRRRLRHGLGRLAHPRALAPREHDDRHHGGENRSHGIVRLIRVLASRIGRKTGRPEIPSTVFHRRGESGPARTSTCRDLHGTDLVAVILKHSSRRGQPALRQAEEAGAPSPRSAPSTDATPARYPLPAALHCVRALSWWRLRTWRGTGRTACCTWWRPR